MAFDPDSRAFTVTANGGLLNVLQTTCHISAAFDPASGGTPPPLFPFASIWDTGASATAISQRVVDQCGLAATGMTKVQTASALEDAETYLVSIALPNGIQFGMLKVTKGNLGPNVDVLVGMDVISQGDFSVTNQNGNTVFSFRIPSAHTVDFVKQQNEAILKARIASSGKGGFRNQKKK